MVTRVYEDPYVFVSLMNVLFALGVVINSLTLFVIWVASPLAMKRYKDVLLGYQLISTLTEVFIHLGLPEIFLPVLAVKVHGPLFAPLDPRPLFVTRAQQGGDSPLMDDILKIFPNHSYLKTVPAVWAGDAEFILPWPEITSAFMFAIVVLGIIFEAVGLCALFICHSYYLLGGHLKMSENRRLMHKRLLTALIWQVVVPFITIAGPWGAGVIIVCGKIDISQEICNLLFYFDGCHALLSSVHILLLTRPYRRYICGMAMRPFSRSVSPQHSVALEHFEKPMAALVYQFGAFLLMAMVIATAACFLYRHRQLLEHGHPLRQPVWRIAIGVGIHYVIYCGTLAYIIQIGRAEKGADSLLMSEIVAKYPDYAFLRSVPGVWVADGSAPFPLLPVSLQTMFCLVIVGIGLVIHSYYLLDGHVKMSESRRLMHKKLLTALVWQVVVPFITLAAPWGAGAVIVYQQLEISQETANLLFYFMGCHGLMSPVQIVLLTRPYRLYVFRLAMRPFSRQVSPKHSIAIEKSMISLVYVNPARLRRGSLRTRHESLPNKY
ncbi:unnamed protein product, partial [Mesorhabditis spiculigera]